jgi:thiol-disulfide isomerase/thioredoxin
MALLAAGVGLSVTAQSNAESGTKTARATSTAGAPGTKPANSRGTKRASVAATKPVKLNIEIPTAAPEIAAGLEWINGNPRTLADLRGKVVLVNFWTFGCINCQRTLPHVKDLYAKYHAKGFEIVGVHSPEFDYEKEIGNVRKAVVDEGITWPVVQDNGFVTWKRYRNRFWPAFYYLDKTGRLRHFHAGEGAYSQQDQVVAALLAE